MDGAVLAANFSKAAKVGVVKVHLVRARQVSKPRGAKPGLVHLSGKIKTVQVDWRKEQPRLEKLIAGKQRRQLLQQHAPVPEAGIQGRQLLQQHAQDAARHLAEPSLTIGRHALEQSWSANSEAAAGVACSATPCGVGEEWCRGLSLEAYHSVEAAAQQPQQERSDA